MVEVGFAVFIALSLLEAVRYLTVVNSPSGRQRRPLGADGDNSVTVVVATFNESKSIVETVRATVSVSPSARVVIADDGSDDATVELCDQMALAESNVTVLKGPRSGKIPTLRNAVSAVETPLVLTLDADTRITAATIPALVATMKSCQLAACAGNLKVDCDGPAVLAFQSLEFALLNGDRRFLGRWSAVSILPGAITMWRTEVLQRLLSPATNDIDLSLQALQEGLRLGFEPAAECHTAVPKTWVGVLRQRRRWARRKVNRVPHLLRAIFGRRGMPARARLSQLHLLIVHVVLGLGAWWIDLWGTFAVLSGVLAGWSAVSATTVAVYGVILGLGTAVSARSDSGVRDVKLILAAGPWERLTRGLAAMSVVVWPQRNTTNWTPSRY